MPPLNNQFQFNPQTFQQPQQNLQTAFTNAGNAVSARSRDTAAARVRSRLAGENRAQQQAIQNQTGRNVGRANFLFDQQRRASQNALATGLADNEQNFANQQLAAAQAQGNIAAAQGGLANQFNQTGIAGAAQRANEAIGFQNADATTQNASTNALNAATNQQKLEEVSRANQQREALDFFNSFATSGATLSESPAFNQRFDKLIQDLFGSQGLNAGAADPATTQAVNTITNPGAAPGFTAPSAGITATTGVPATANIGGQTFTQEQIINGLRRGDPRFAQFG